MAPYFASLVAAGHLKADAALLSTLEAANAAKLAEIDAKLKDATENLGEVEVTDALIARANHYARIGSPQALQALDEAVAKTGPLGRRIDLHFTIIRLGFFFSDTTLVSSTIDKVKMYYFCQFEAYVF
jgi:26S proteasome regulatory subunit N7